MALRTITEPSADVQQVELYNHRMRRSNNKVLAVGQKFAVCLIRLADAVNQPGDYAALKVAIEAIPGIQEINLLIDGQCPASIPADKHLVGYVEAHLRIDHIPTP